MKRPTITASMRLDVFKQHGAVCLCQVCGNVHRIGDMDIDHHLALIDGGEHSASNLRPLCSKCHAPKSANEHKNNAKSKRLEKAQAIHKDVVSRVTERKPGKIKSRPFQGHRKFNGELVRR